MKRFKTRKYRCFFALVGACLLLLTTACNGDIFIDGKELPDFSEFTIDGDGGEVSFPFSRKGLSAIRISSSQGVAEYLKYYGINSDEIDSGSHASEIRSIYYDTPVMYYSVAFIGDILYFSSNYNYIGIDNVVTLSLEYDYGVTKEIQFTITPEGSLNVWEWYEGEIEVDEDIEQITHRRGFVNNSSISQRMEVMPYISSNCVDMVVPEQNWAKDLVVDMRLLTFEGKYWTHKSYKDIRLGERRTFSPSAYSMDKIVVDVPANSKCTVTYTLHYSRATQSGKLYFAKQNDTGGYPSESGFTCTAIYATSFDYTVSYE